MLAVSGFFIAAHIWAHKRKKKPLICPLRLSCDTVVNSDHGRIVGIPVEVLGMLYYMTMVVLHMAYGIGMPVPHMVFVVISGVAFGFSLYLIGVQAFIMRTWCSWCLMSAVISTVIFALTAWY